MGHYKLILWRYRMAVVWLYCITSIASHTTDNSPIVSTAKKVVYYLNPAQNQAIERLSKQKEKGFRETAKYSNLSKSLYFWAFQNFFTCFVTVDIPSQHGLGQCRECPLYMGTNHMPVYGETNRLRYHMNISMQLMRCAGESGVNLPPALRPYSGSKLEVRLQEDNVRRLPLFLIFQIQTSVMLTHHNMHLRLIAVTQEFFRNRCTIHLFPFHCHRFHTILNMPGIEARRVDGQIVEAVAGDAKQHRRQPPGYFHLPVVRKKSTSLLPFIEQMPVLMVKLGHIINEFIVGLSLFLRHVLSVHKKRQS